MTAFFEAFSAFLATGTIWVYLVIFFGKIVEVSLGTLRIVTVFNLTLLLLCTVLAVLLAVLLFAPGRCIYQNRTVAEMNEYVTAFTYKGESYRSVDPPYGYVLGTQIGKTQNGYRLFRAEGDAGEQFLIAEHIGPRADPICFAKEGTQIPGEGTVSSAIIGRKATADEHILRAVQAIMEAAQDEAVAYDEAGTGRLELYLCFEGCPVSNRSAGTFLYVDQQAWYYESRPKSGALTPVTDERLLSFL